MKILIADYVLPISSPPIPDGAVCVDADQVVAVGSRHEITQRFPQAEREVFTESAIMPGLVNVHSHLELTILRSLLDSVERDFKSWLLKLVRARRLLSDSELEISALAGAIEGIRAGVTCFADIGNRAKAGFQALKQTGLRGISFQETNFSPSSSRADTDFSELKEKFLDLQSSETSLVKASISPHAPYTVSRALFEKIADYAIENDLKPAIHVAESKEEIKLLTEGSGFASFYKDYEFISPRMSPVKYLNETGILEASPLLIHCVYVSEEEIEIIKNRQCSIAHCPKSNAKFGHGRAPLEKFLRAKIHVGLGTDSVASNNLCDMFEEARFACFLARMHEFIESYDLLQMLTIGGAVAIGLSNIGTLESGKQADLIAVKLNRISQLPVYDVQAALLFSSQASDVCFTMIAGREVFRDGEVKTIDENLVKKEFIKIASKIEDGL